MAVSKRYIVNLTNGAFDIAGDVIDSLQDKVTDFFNEITQEVKGFIFPPELSGHGIFDLAFGGGDKRLRKAGSSLTAEEETMDSSVKATYLDYQVPPLPLCPPPPFLPALRIPNATTHGRFTTAASEPPSTA